MIDRREFLAGGLSAAAAASSAGAAGTRSDWFRRNARVFLLDFQVPDPVDQGAPGMPHFFQRLDPAEIVDQVADAGANVLLAHAKCNQGNAYYNTRVGHKHSDLGDRDLMAEFSRLCRKKGLGILYYIQLSRERRSFTHAERRAVDASGQPVLRKKDNPLLAAQEEVQIVCMNGPHRQYIKDILEELSKGYDFDGFWLDCFSWWGRTIPCFCEFCKQSYRRDTGAEIPRTGLATSEEGKRYFRWRKQLHTTIMKELVGAVRAANPKLTLTHNGSAVSPFFDWEFCDGEDYLSHEFHFNEGYAHLSQLCQMNRSLKPGAPFEIEIWRFANRNGGQRFGSRDYQVRPPETLLSEMASVAANGGFPQYYDQVRPDGTLDPNSLKAVRPALREVAARQPWAGVGEQVPYAAVLWSKSTEGYTPKEAQALHRDAAAGCFCALMESHLPAAMISERDAAAGRWRGARVAIVDAAESIPADCARGLEKFVMEGGGLVITHRSSLRDGEGKLLPNFGLAELMGADFQGMTEHWYSFFSPGKEHPATAGLTLEFPLPVYETLQARVRARSGAEALAVIVNPLKGFHMGYPPHERTDFPGLLCASRGKGRVVYASASLGAVYERNNHRDNKRLIASAVQWAAGSAPPVTAKAPGTVEMTAWRDEAKRRTIVHLVNRTGAGLPRGEGEMMHEVIPVYGVEIRLCGSHAGQTARVQPSGRPLPVRRDGADAIATLDRLDVWEVVEIT